MCAGVRGGGENGPRDLFDIKQGLPDVTTTPRKSPARPPAVPEMPPLSPGLCAQCCPSCPSTRRRGQWAQGREVMRPLPPSRKGKEGCRKPASPASQFSCQLHGSGQLFRPFQLSQALSPRQGETQSSISPKYFTAKGPACANPQGRDQASAGDSELDSGSGAGRGPSFPGE